MAKRKTKSKTSRSKNRERKTGKRAQGRASNRLKKQGPSSKRVRAPRTGQVPKRKKRSGPKSRISGKSESQFARGKSGDVIGYARLYKINPGTRSSYVDGLARVSQGLNTAFETDKRTQIKILVEGNFKVRVGSGGFAGDKKSHRTFVAVIPSFQQIGFIESQAGSLNFLNVLQTFGGFLYDELKIIPDDMKKVRQGSMSADAARREIYAVRLISKLNFEVE